MKVQPAAGGGRWAEISPHRLAGWIDGFYQRHDGATEEGLRLLAANGDTAELHEPPGIPAGLPLDDFLQAVQTPRRLGFLLARKNAVAIGVAYGEKLVSSKVETYYVQGRTAAGGWSQQRYARRRENQGSAAVKDAADIALRLLIPPVSTLSALVTGGDRPTVEAILADPRLEELVALRHPRLLEVAEPRLAVLEEAVKAAYAVRIHLVP